MDEEVLVLTIVIFVCIFINLICLFALKYNAIYKRRYNVSYLKLLLNEKDKIKDKEDLEYLEKNYKKLENYAQKWWYNNTPIYALKQRKIESIAKKYNLKIEVFN
ncbi:MAG: hypothetical protein TYPL_5160 [Candidatus Tyloplasma litorale]|nr:MAG: hypothetical protein TYPL_5160 [Mycoplasmatales bacterium]